MTLQALWPPPDAPTTGPGDGSTANEASVVLLAEVRGIRILLTGDIEPEGQAALAARRCRASRVDVLKVPHHGSRYQDEDLAALPRRPGRAGLRRRRQRLRPPGRRATLAPLEAAGTRVLRTDQRRRPGDVIERDGELLVDTG